MWCHTHGAFKTHCEKMGPLLAEKCCPKSCRLCKETQCLRNLFEEHGEPVDRKGYALKWCKDVSYDKYCANPGVQACCPRRCSPKPWVSCRDDNKCLQAKKPEMRCHTFGMFRPHCEEMGPLLAKTCCPRSCNMCSCKAEPNGAAGTQQGAPHGAAAATQQGTQDSAAMQQGMPYGGTATSQQGAPHGAMTAIQQGTRYGVAAATQQGAERVATLCAQVQYVVAHAVHTSRCDGWAAPWD